MPIGTPMRSQPRIHQPQTVQKLRSRAKRTPDSRNSRPLMQRKCRRHIQNFIHLCLRRTRHTSSRISRKRFQIPPGSLRIQHPQRQRRLPGAGHTCDAYDLVQGDIYVYVLQVVDSGTSDLDVFGVVIVIVHWLFSFISYIFD